MTTTWNRKAAHQSSSCRGPMGTDSSARRSTSRAWLGSSEGASAAAATLPRWGAALHDGHSADSGSAWPRGRPIASTWRACCAPIPRWPQRGQRIRLAQKAPDRIDRGACCAPIPRPRRWSGCAVAACVATADLTDLTGTAVGSTTGGPPGRAGPGAVRRADLAWAAPPAARHRPATPHAGRASGRVGYGGAPLGPR